LFDVLKGSERPFSRDTATQHCKQTNRGCIMREISLLVRPMACKKLFV